MNRRSFFKMVAAAVAACAVPLPAIAQRRYRYAGTVTGRWGIGSITNSKVFERENVGYRVERSVFKEVPLTVEQARKRRASEIRRQREEILGVREELKYEQQKLAELRAKPLDTTGTKVVKVGPDDPDYDDWRKYAGDLEWMSRQMERSPWIDLVEQKPFPANMGSKLVRLT